MKQKIITAKAPKVVGPYSQAIGITIVKGKYIFTSGQIHITPEGKLLEGNIEVQTHQIMKNLQAVLEAAGVGFQDVVKATIYMTDLGNYAKVNEVYGSYFSEPFPARETVQVAALPAGAKVEISLVAVKNI